MGGAGGACGGSTTDHHTTVFSNMGSSFNEASLDENQKFVPLRTKQPHTMKRLMPMVSSSK